MAPTFHHYVVLNTVHIRCATAELLESWSRLPPGDRPIAVASTGFGWFIPTTPIDAASLAHIPAELPQIIAFGRSQGCDQVLLDSDGPRMPGLTEFPW
jgi:hypothetical protein